MRGWKRIIAEIQMVNPVGLGAIRHQERKDGITVMCQCAQVGNAKGITIILVVMIITDFKRILLIMMMIVIHFAKI